MERREVRETKTPSILKEIRYKKGEEGKVAFLPILEDLPILHGFTWGENSQTMSEKFIDKRTQTGEDSRQRVLDFLVDHNMSLPPNTYHILGRFDGTHQQIQELNGKDEFVDRHFSDAHDVLANFVFTREPRYSMIIKPGDCPVSIVYAKDRKGKDILGIDHSSGVSVNAGMPRLSIRHLLEEENVIPSSIKIGIVPGISKEHYFITQEEPRPLIVERNWREHISLKQTENDEEERYVDLLGATLMQFIEEGVSPDNIEAYDIDTWEAAKKGETFSNRYTQETGERTGRFMVAAQLKKG